MFTVAWLVKRTDEDDPWELVFDNNRYFFKEMQVVVLHDEPIKQ